VYGLGMPASVFASIRAQPEDEVITKEKVAK
jgi:hypothetical protein